MRYNTLNVGIASTAILLALVPATFALPGWLQPQERDASRDQFAPPEYSVYEGYGGGYHGSYGGYTYGGIGPRPTVSNAPASSTTTSSANEGEVTSLSISEKSSKLGRKNKE